jgi:uncharacterized protein (TIGR02996 family)
MSNDERPFLAAIAAEPHDALRRLVYADWLDERSDPRGEYLRLLSVAAGWQPPAADRDATLDRLQRLGAECSAEWKAAVQLGVNWRMLFEVNLRPVEQREYEVMYTFNPPATGDELDETERKLGVRLPADVRSLWGEFNGVVHVFRADPARGFEKTDYLLDLMQVVSVTEIMRDDYRWEEVFDEEYGEGTFGKLLYIAAFDGLATAWLLCLEDAAGHPAGTVLFHDHDTPELPALAAGLTDLIARRFTERFSHW